jgi:hypothetical protein
MSNPIKAVIILGEKSADQPLGCGCTTLLIAIPLTLFFWGTITRSCSVLLVGEDKVRIEEIAEEKSKLEKEINYEIGLRKEGMIYADKSDEEFKKMYDELNKLRLEEYTIKKKLSEKKSKIQEKIEEKPQLQEVEVKELKDLELPAVCIAVSDLKLLDGVGKEVDIKSDTLIKVSSRSSKGIYTFVINGQTLIGHEDRVREKLKIK